MRIIIKKEVPSAQDKFIRSSTEYTLLRCWNVKNWSSNIIHASRSLTESCLMSGNNDNGTIFSRPSVSQPCSHLAALSEIEFLYSRVCVFNLTHNACFYFSMFLTMVFSPAETSSKKPTARYLLSSFKVKIVIICNFRFPVYQRTSYLS